MLQQWDRRDWLVWTGWIVANGVGWLLCLMNLVASGIATADNLATSVNTPPDISGYVIFLAVLWGIVGIAQWLLLRVYVHRTYRWVAWWVLACSVSWTGFWLLVEMYPPELSVINILIAGVFGGLGISLLQWLVLRPFLGVTGWWIVISPSAMVIVIVMVWSFNQIILQTLGGASNLLLLDIFIPGITYGAITGFFMIFFVKRA